jgi:acyl-CoA thioester hydrolase
MTTPTDLHQTDVEILVPFHDVDAMRIVWHGNYAKYFEVARCALLDSIDYDYQQMGESGYAWPVIDLKVRFGAPARFGDRLVVTATLREWVQRMRISYRIVNAATGKRITRGSTTQVPVSLATNEMCYTAPDVLFEKLGLTRDTTADVDPAP